MNFSEISSVTFANLIYQMVLTWWRIGLRQTELWRSDSNFVSGSGDPDGCISIFNWFVNPKQLAQFIVRKFELPQMSIGTHGSSSLTLITCGGEWIGQFGELPIRGTLILASCAMIIMGWARAVICNDRTLSDSYTFRCFIRLEIRGDSRLISFRASMAKLLMIQCGCSSRICLRTLLCKIVQISATISITLILDWRHQLLADSSRLLMARSI